MERQEIYFASTKQLNDPVEGYKDLFWKGDAIAWKNFLRHYVLCLMQTILRALENVEEYVVTSESGMATMIRLGASGVVKVIEPDRKFDVV